MKDMDNGKDHIKQETKNLTQKGGHVKKRINARPGQGVTSSLTDSSVSYKIFLNRPGGQVLKEFFLNRQLRLLTGILMLISILMAETEESLT